MKLTPALPALALSVLPVLVAACSQKSAAGEAKVVQAPPAAAAAAKPASGPDTVITRADLPHLRAGYWETVHRGDDGEVDTSHFCSSGAPMKPQTVDRRCQSFQLKRTFLGAYVIDAACAEGPFSSTMHITVSGDFNHRYTIDGRSVLQMQGRPAQTLVSHSVASYVGPCPAGAVAADG